MKTLLLTVSYMNDYEQVADWLDLFYASLKHQESYYSKIDHFVILNDENKSKAKSNIEKAKNRYSLEDYNILFEESGYHKKQMAVGHGNSLRLGISKIDETVNTDDYDIFLVQEFDVVHRKNFAKRIQDVKNVCEKFDCLVGEFTKKISNKKNQNIEIEFPRIFPHFLVLSPKKFTDFKMFSQFFGKTKSGFIRKVSNKISNAYLCASVDTGSDFFHHWTKHFNFFHITDENFYDHIKGTTVNFFYLKNITYQKDRSVYLLNLSRKFKIVKQNYSYLPFHKDSIFQQEIENVRKKWETFQ